MRTLACALATLLLLSCSDPATSGLAPGDDETTQAHQGLQAEAVLQFNADWSVRQSAALVQGNRLRFEYSASRIQDCLGNFEGNPGWVATAHYLLGDAPERTVQVGGYTPSGFSSLIELDREGELTVWFEVTNRWGCQWFDSAYGQNYRFPVTTAATVRFNADWTMNVEGDLSTAKAINVEYALERLPNCRAHYHGQPAWDILAYARFDGGPTQNVTVTRGFGNDRAAVPGAFAVPAGAREMELWFFASDAFSCRQYDSNWSQNYHVKLR